MESQNQPKTKLRILLTSDLHLHYDNLTALGKVINDSKEKLDLILCSGDIANFDPEDEPLLERVSACEGEMSTALQLLENIYYKLIYIPGNHDARTTIFNEPDSRPKLTSFSQNAHRCTIRLADDLVLMGLGGSLPGYRDGQQAWYGFPYKTDTELDNELQSTWNDAKESTAIKETDAVILMTHVGPHSSSTTVDKLDVSSAPVYSGSKSIDQFIVDHNQQILFNVHGHTHFASGMTNVGKTTIINPGSVKFAKYALLTIEKKNINQPWKVSSVEFKNLQ